MAVIYQPCNQFGGQEPNSGVVLRDQIWNYYKNNNFPMTENQIWLEKADVIGENASPLFQWLQKKEKKWGWFSWGGEISWNFEKFIVVNGVVRKRHGSNTDPVNLDGDIKKYIKELKN